MCEPRTEPINNKNVFGASSSACVCEWVSGAHMFAKCKRVLCEHGMNENSELYRSVFIFVRFFLLFAQYIIAVAVCVVYSVHRVLHMTQTECKAEDKMNEKKNTERERKIYIGRARSRRKTTTTTTTMKDGFGTIGTENASERDKESKI